MHASADLASFNLGPGLQRFLSVLSIEASNDHEVLIMRFHNTRSKVTPAGDHVGDLLPLKGPIPLNTEAFR